MTSQVTPNVSSFLTIPLAVIALPAFSEAPGGALLGATDRIAEIENRFSTFSRSPASGCQPAGIAVEGPVSCWSGQILSTAA